MGYYFDITGEITFEDKKAFAIMKLLYKEKQEPFNQEVDGFDLVDESLRLDISLNIKNLDSYIEKLCFFIHSLDKKAYGEIDVTGEDSEDKHFIDIGEKGIKISTAEIIWKKQKGYYMDKDTKQNVNKLLKNKELDKKLICQAIEGK